MRAVAELFAVAVLATVSDPIGATLAPRHVLAATPLPGTDAREGGTISGTIVKQPSGGRIVIRPYGEARDVTLDLGPTATIRQGGGTITTQGLLPGVDVRASYSRVGEVTSVEVLSPEEARAERAAPPDRQGEIAAEEPTIGWTGAQGIPERFRAGVEADSAGSQNGRIVSSGSGWLELDPYQRSAGKARLRLEPATPVFRGGARTSTDSLRPGEDVRVFYSEESRGTRRVVAVEAIPAGDAARLEQAERDVPRRNEP